MRVWWCEKHKSQQFDEDSCWLRAAVPERLEPPCVIAERQLVSTTPVGYLVYGEYIPYEVWIENLPFAAPTDQVIALYAEEGT